MAPDPRAPLPFRVGQHLQARLLEGLLLIVPLLVTYLVLRLMVGFVNSLLSPLLHLVKQPSPPWLLPVAIILALFLLYLAGVIVHTVIGRRLANTFNALVERIPLIRLIYRTTRQATDIFSGVTAGRFRRVVLVEFPRPGVKSMGFVTSEAQGSDGGRFLTVFIPTVPNPTTGFLLFLRDDQVQETGMTTEEAFKLILSGGILIDEVARSLAQREAGLIITGRKPDADPQKGLGGQPPSR